MYGITIPTFQNLNVIISHSYPFQLIALQRYLPLQSKGVQKRYRTKRCQSGIKSGSSIYHSTQKRYKSGIKAVSKQYQSSIKVVVVSTYRPNQKEAVQKRYPQSGSGIYRPTQKRYQSGIKAVPKWPPHSNVVSKRYQMGYHQSGIKEEQQYNRLYTKKLLGFGCRFCCLVTAFQSFQLPQLLQKLNLLCS